MMGRASGTIGTRGMVWCGAAAVDGDQDGSAARGLAAARLRARCALFASALAIQLPAFISARGKNARGLSL